MTEPVSTAKRCVAWLSSLSQNQPAGGSSTTTTQLCHVSSCFSCIPLHNVILNQVIFHRETISLSLRSDPPKYSR